MFKKFIVFTRTINLSDGENVTTATKDTEREAYDLFYDNLSKFGGNEQTKAVEVIIFNPSGNIEKIDTRDNSEYITSEPIEE